MIPDWQLVTTAIAQAEAAGARLGVSLIAPSGARFAHNADRRFIAASTIKIGIMIELFRQIDAGKHMLDDRHTLSTAEKSGGSGILAHLHAGIDLTMADLVFLMMSISDNTATNLLIDRVGMAEVNAALQTLGTPQSRLGRKMTGRPGKHESEENWVVPNEFATLIDAILTNQAASANACAQMVALLEQQQNDRRIARHLPSQNRPRWGSKTGSLPGIVNDIGFIMTDAGPLILAVLCEWPGAAVEGEDIIGAVAKAALSAVG